MVRFRPRVGPPQGRVQLALPPHEEAEAPRWDTIAQGPTTEHRGGATDPDVPGTGHRPECWVGREQLG